MKYLLIIRDVRNTTAVDNVRIRTDAPFATISAGDTILGAGGKGEGSGLAPSRYVVESVEHTIVEEPELEHCVFVRVKDKPSPNWMST